MYHFNITYIIIVYVVLKVKSYSFIIFKCYFSITYYIIIINQCTRLVIVFNPVHEA